MNDERLRLIVDRARQLSGAAQSAFLDGASAGDPSVRARLEGMLLAEDAARSSVDDAAADSPVRESFGATEMDATEATVITPSAEGPGTTIGRYRLLQQIGEGGFGAVFMAEQREPVRRKVALKIIKLGMDTRQVMARFEAERQALAMMDHPNIARVLDAGATGTGRPFFVMELVKGIPITEYCDRNNLTLRERLELFVPVCHAIQHAHQKGIIHRDIKPSNVLVTLHDGVPAPKVIDFGIAKATSSDLTEKTVFTEFRQFIGTPEYMSPEQAEMSGLDIDTRSDVYSLGVLLYELITGATPFDSATLRSRGHAEIQRMLVEEDAPRPSTRLSTLREQLTSIAKNRRVEPGRLRAMLQGDLDWITLKAMEKDRTRRYETARDLAEDVQRHLRSEPILAAPPSRVYRARKLMRRHRAAATAAGIFAVTMVVAVVGTSWGMVRAHDAERAAVASAASESRQREIAEENERLAVDAALRAEREADRALAAERAAEARAAELERMTAFQTSMIRNIDVAVMADGMRRNVVAEARRSMERAELDAEGIEARMETLEETLAWANFSNPAVQSIEQTILARSADEIRLRFADQPLLQAELLQIVAETRSALGFGLKAVETLEEIVRIRSDALGPDDSLTLASAAMIGSVEMSRGRWPEAIRIFSEVKSRASAALGDDHPLKIVLGYLVQDGNLDPMFIAGDPEQLRWWAIMTPALTVEEAMVAGRAIPRIFDILDEAGLTPGSTVDGMAPDRLSSVMDAFDGVFRDLEEGLGINNPLILGFYAATGRNARTLGMPDRAEPYLREGLEKQRRILGDDHPSTLTTMFEYALVLADLDEYEASYRLAREALVAVRRTFGADHPVVAQVQDVLIRNLLAMDRTEEAIQYARHLIERLRQDLGDDPEEMAAAFAVRGQLLLGANRLEAALLADELLTECVEIRRRALPGHWLLSNAESLLGGARAQVAKWDPDLSDSERYERLQEALSDLKRGYEGLMKAEGLEDELRSILPARQREALRRLVDCYEALHALEPGGGYAEEAVRYRAQSSEES